MEESKHTTITCSCSNIVTWDLWMAQRAFVIKRQGNTDQQSIGRIAEAPVPYPPSPVPCLSLLDSHTNTQNSICCSFCYALVAQLREVVAHAEHMLSEQTRQSGSLRRSIICMSHADTSRWWSPNRRFIKRKSDTINILSSWKNKSAPVPLFALLCHFLTRRWLIHSSSHWHFSV